jgi:hypothetical protein
MCIRLRRRNLKITTSNGSQPEHDSGITDAPVMHQGLYRAKLDAGLGQTFFWAG